MPTQAAGVLLYRLRPTGPEVFLVHPGGPFWARKDSGAWSIPKGGCEPGEDPLAAAQRELREETGFTVAGPFAELGSFRVTSSKILRVFTAEADVDPSTIVSNRIQLEWPPRSGRLTEFPEVDRASWFTLELAREKLHRGQQVIVEHFEAALARAR